jgi:hypothetical protein
MELSPPPYFPFWGKNIHLRNPVLCLQCDMFAELCLNDVIGGTFCSEALHFISNSIGTRHKFRCVS